VECRACVEAKLVKDREALSFVFVTGHDARRALLAEYAEALISASLSTLSAVLAGSGFESRRARLLAERSWRFRSRSRLS